jgi:hypothetical protein
MSKIKVNLDSDVKEYVLHKYRQKGYPLGKSVRGYKKWCKAFVLKALKKLAGLE